MRPVASAVEEAIWEGIPIEQSTTQTTLQAITEASLGPLRNGSLRKTSVVAPGEKELTNVW